MTPNRHNTYQRQRNLASACGPDRWTPYGRSYLSFTQAYAAVLDEFGVLATRDVCGKDRRYLAGIRIVDAYDVVMWRGKVEEPPLPVTNDYYVIETTDRAHRQQLPITPENYTALTNLAMSLVGLGKEVTIHICRCCFDSSTKKDTP